MEKHVFLGINVTYYTRLLTLPPLDPKRERRLRLLYDLHESGVTTRQISDWFNDLGIKTPRGTTYSPSLVWMTLKKWKSRQSRLIDSYLVISPPRFYWKKSKAKKPHKM